MSDIRFNQWLHQSGTGVSQVASGAVGVGTTNPLADFYVRGDAQITGRLTAGHIAMGSSITFGDDDRAYFGDGTDLQIYHNGADNYIDATTGSLYIRNTLPTNTVFQTGNFLIKNQSNNQNVANFAPGANGGGLLYHENVLRFNTTSSGAVVTGILTATAVSYTHLTLPTSG